MKIQVALMIFSIFFPGKSKLNFCFVMPMIMNRFKQPGNQGFEEEENIEFMLLPEQCALVKFEKSCQAKQCGPSKHRLSLNHRMSFEIFLLFCSPFKIITEKFVLTGFDYRILGTQLYI